MSSQKKKLKLQIDVDEASEYENSLAVRFWWVWIFNNKSK